MTAVYVGGAAYSGPSYDAPGRPAQPPLDARKTPKGAEGGGRAAVRQAWQPQPQQDDAPPEMAQAYLDAPPVVCSDAPPVSYSDAPPVVGASMASDTSVESSAEVRGPAPPAAWGAESLQQPPPPPPYWTNAPHTAVMPPPLPGVSAGGSGGGQVIDVSPGGMVVIVEQQQGAPAAADSRKQKQVRRTMGAGKEEQSASRGASLSRPPVPHSTTPSPSPSSHGVDPCEPPPLAAVPPALGCAGGRGGAGVVLIYDGGVDRLSPPPPPSPGRLCARDRRHGRLLVEDL